MLAFVICVNGKQVCSIGLTPENTRGVDVSWIPNPKGEIFLRAGGMDDREHVDWAMPELGVGDELTIKITECDEVDPPSRRRTMEQVHRWVRSLRPPEEGKQAEGDLPPLPAPWE